jgi:hypothetical protein
LGNPRPRNETGSDARPDLKRLRLLGSVPAALDRDEPYFNGLQQNSCPTPATSKQTSHLAGVTAPPRQLLSSGNDLSKLLVDGLGKSIRKAEGVSKEPTTMV